MRYEITITFDARTSRQAGEIRDVLAEEINEHSLADIAKGHAVAVDAVRLVHSEYMREMLRTADWRTMPIDELLQGTFSNPSELDALAKEYLARTTAYDRKVCTGSITADGRMPATPNERREIIHHAQEVLREVAERARLMGFKVQELRQAIKRADVSGSLHCM